MNETYHRVQVSKATVGEKKMTDDYIDPADLPDGEHLALVRWSDGVEAPRYVNRSGLLATTASHTVKWEHTSARIVTLLHRADERSGGGWESAELGPHLAGQAVRVETLHGAVEGVVKWDRGGFVGVYLGEDFGYQWFDEKMVVRVFTRPDPHAYLIEQLHDLLADIPEGEIERVVMRAKAAKPGGAS